MHLFYIPGVNLRQSFDAGEVLHTLTDMESAHMKVMRLKAGDALRLTDGIGHFADAAKSHKITASLLLSCFHNHYPDTYFFYFKIYSTFA